MPRSKAPVLSSADKLLVATAEGYGRAAHRGGRMRAPGADRDMAKLLASQSRPVGDPTTIAMLKAFLRGWDAEWVRSARQA